MMKLSILDDYQDVVRTLPCFGRIANHDVTIFNDPAPDAAVLASRLHETEALLLFRERTAIPRELLVQLPRLRMISLVGPVPHVDLLACTELGITVCSRIVTAQPSYPTAELTWALVLAAWRRIPQEAAHLRAGGWQSAQAVGSTLRGRTLGIFGYGRIGALVARYGRAFDMRIMAWGREGSLARAAADAVECAASCEALFSQSDVLSLHLGLNDGTRGIVRRDHLALMKESALLVNTSRAQLIENGALVNALRQGRPGRAAVDVFEQEPLLRADHPLLQLPNVVATPHLGYLARDSLDLMFGTMFEQVLAFERGEPVNVLTGPTEAWPPGERS
jgi:D-3-phosphoglycerate dehydrogenase